MIVGDTLTVGVIPVVYVEPLDAQPHPPKRGDPSLLVLVVGGDSLHKLSTERQHDGADILHLHLRGTGVGHQVGVVHGLHTHKGVGHGVGWDGGNRVSGHGFPFVS